jgi:hypothetical protein
VTPGRWWILKTVLYLLAPLIIFDMLDGIPDQTLVFGISIVKSLLNG